MVLRLRKQRGVDMKACFEISRRSIGCMTTEPTNKKNNIPINKYVHTGTYIATSIIICLNRVK